MFDETRRWQSVPSRLVRGGHTRLLSPHGPAVCMTCVLHSSYGSLGSTGMAAQVWLLMLAYHHRSCCAPEDGVEPCSCRCSRSELPVAACSPPRAPALAPTMVSPAREAGGDDRPASSSTSSVSGLLTPGALAMLRQEFFTRLVQPVARHLVGHVEDCVLSMRVWSMRRTACRKSLDLLRTCSSGDADTARRKSMDSGAWTVRSSVT